MDDVVIDLRTNLFWPKPKIKQKSNKQTNKIERIFCRNGYWAITNNTRSCTRSVAHTFGHHIQMDDVVIRQGSKHTLIPAGKGLLLPCC